jgi:xanthine dehydrogenase accessory factor
MEKDNPLLLQIQEKVFFPEAEKTWLYLEPVHPPAHLVIAGAGHIGRALAHIGRLLDFEVTVIDDRSEFANSERIPDADRLIVDDIGKALSGIEMTSDTYIVIVTRGHKADADALKACIQTDIPYIGMIGSKRKIELMRKKFLERKWATAEEFDRVHAPIGIEIGSQTVQEIAVSIAAQLIKVLRGKNHPGRREAWFGP